MSEMFSQEAHEVREAAGVYEWRHVHLKCPVCNVRRVLMKHSDGDRTPASVQHYECENCGNEWADDQEPLP